MFIDIPINPITRAPAERNVRHDEYARSATFRSYGARRMFLKLAFYKHFGPTGRGSGFRKNLVTKNKKLIICFAERTNVIF